MILLPGGLAPPPTRILDPPLHILFTQVNQNCNGVFTPTEIFSCLSMESIRLGGPVHGIETKTVHKTLPGGGGGPVGRWVGRGVVGSRGW